MTHRLIILVILIVLASCTNQTKMEVTRYYQAQTNKPYDDVLQELEIAISEHNFRITGHSRVGKVIRKRGTKSFPEYDTIQFCNLTHAREMLEISPHAIRHMPCNVVTYQYDGKTIVKIRLLPNDPDNPKLDRFYDKMNKELQAIVDFAVEE